MGWRRVMLRATLVVARAAEWREAIDGCEAEGSVQLPLNGKL